MGELMSHSSCIVCALYSDSCHRGASTEELNCAQACLHYALQGERRRKSDDFVLTHMTGMHQSKQEYIRAIAGGTLNYYSAEHEQMEIKVNGNHATLTGRSRVTAAVFGGRRHIWRLQLHFNLSKEEGRWYFTSARASTYLKGQ